MYKEKKWQAHTQWQVSRLASSTEESRHQCEQNTHGTKTRTGSADGWRTSQILNCPTELTAATSDCERKQTAFNVQLSAASKQQRNVYRSAPDSHSSVLYIRDPFLHVKYAACTARHKLHRRAFWCSICTKHKGNVMRITRENLAEHRTQK